MSQKYDDLLYLFWKYLKKNMAKLLCLICFLSLIAAVWAQSNIENFDDLEVIQTFSGHESGMVAYSDSATLAVVSIGTYVYVIDANQNQRILTLTHPDTVYAVAVSSDGQLVATSNNSTIKIWRVSDGNLYKTLSDNGTKVTGIAFHPDGELLASTGNDKNVKLWEITSGKVARSFNIENEGYTLAFDLDGNILGIVLVGGIELWNVWDSELLYYSKRPPWLGYGFTLGGPYITQERYWYTTDELHNQQEYDIVKNGLGKYGSHPCHKDIGWEFTNGFQVSLKCVEQNYYYRAETFMQEGYTLYDTYSPDSSAISISFSPDSTMLASSGRGTTVNLWNIENGELIRTFEGHNSSRSSLSRIAWPTNWVASVAFSPDGHALASMGGDSEIIYWDVTSGKPLHEFYTPNCCLPPSPNIVTFSSSGNTLAFIEMGIVGFWDMSSNPENIRGIGIYAPIGAFSPDLQIVATGETGTNRDESLSLINSEDGTTLYRLNKNIRDVSALVFNPNGDSFVSGERNGTITIWDVNTGMELHSFQGHADAIFSLAFSPDGNVLASGGADNIVNLWQASDWQHLGFLDEHSDDIRTLAFSPDGRYLAVGAGVLEHANTITLYGKADKSPIFSSLQQKPIIQPDKQPKLVSYQDELFSLEVPQGWQVKSDLEEASVKITKDPSNQLTPVINIRFVRYYKTLDSLIDTLGSKSNVLKIISEQEILCGDTLSTMEENSLPISMALLVVANPKFDLSLVFYLQSSTEEFEASSGSSLLKTIAKHIQLKLNGQFNYVMGDFSKEDFMTEECSVSNLTPIKANN